MKHGPALIQALWQLALILLCCLGGIVVVIALRVGLRLSWHRPGERWFPRTRRPVTPRPDPWKAAADRLAVPPTEPHPEPTPDDPTRPPPPLPPEPPEPPESPKPPRPRS